MIRRPPRSTQSRSSAASDVYKRQGKGNFASCRESSCCWLALCGRSRTLVASPDADRPERTGEPESDAAKTHGPRARGREAKKILGAKVLLDEPDGVRQTGGLVHDREAAAREAVSYTHLTL